MYRSKKDIDRHVEGLLTKLSPKEFNSRAYSVARLYFEVGDCVSCQKYVELYLSQRGNNAAAHKLLGQALHKQGEKEKALEQYKISLEIDATQTSLILDICELLSDDGVFVDAGRAKYWCEKAEATFPKHPVTFRLREKILATDNPDPEAIIKLLRAELAMRPKDSVLHARLLKHYLQNNKVKEAFDHSFNVEFNENAFANNIAWYDSISEILKKNSTPIKEWQNQLLLLTVRERLCALSISEIPHGSSKSLIESSELLCLYDQAIQAVANAGAPGGFAEFHAGLIQHHHGQFSYHLATYYLKKAKNNQMSWRDAKKLAGPLMLIAWHTIPLDTKVNWLNHAPEKQKIAVHRWYLDGTYRCSQSGHYILSNNRDKNQIFLDNVSQTCSGKNWKETYYDKVFVSKDPASKNISFIMSDKFTAPTLRIPRKSEVEAYDVDAQCRYPSSLHHFVWILLNYNNFANMKCNLFDMLTPKTNNYQNCGPETLSKLDVYAFVYSAAITAQQKVQQSTLDSNDRPIVLPADITDLLCSPSQMKWWDCAYKFSQNTLGTELTDIRVTLSRGIEVVRCIDNHGMDPELLCKLGRIFRELSQLSTGVDEKINLELKAGHYYLSAMTILEKIKNNITVRVPDKRLFGYSHKDLSNKHLNSLIEECRLNVAKNNIQNSEYEKAIDLLSTLKSPEAFYHLAETYKTMAVEEFNISKDSNPGVKSKYSAFLSKARHFAFKSLNTLKDTQMGSSNQLFSNTQQLIEEIETKINSVDLDNSANLSDVEPKYLSDENGTLPENPVRLNSQAFRNLSSTPKQPVNRNLSSYRTAVESQIFDNTQVDQRSLERIEDQIKNLQRRDANVNDFIEKTNNWFEMNKDLGKMIGSINANIQSTTDQFKQLEISVDQVKKQINECIKECNVDELKKQIAELRKEVSKLKKASSEQGIDESDVYSLEEDYRTNDNTSTYSAQLPFNTAQVLPQLNQRLVPPFPVPPNPYNLYGQNLYNYYSHYSQFAPGSVPGAPPMFDVNRPQMNFPGIFPTPEQVYPDMAHLLPAAPLVPPVPPVPPVAAPTPTVAAPKTIVPTSSKETSNSLPVNVVITSSDPLPTCTTVPQPVLSVTIPPKHIKGTPHNYQIAMPVSSENQVTPTIFSSPALGNSTPTKPNFTNWSQSSDFKSKENSANNTLTMFDGFKSFDNSTTVVDGTISSPNVATSLNKSRTLSEKSNTSVDNYDPCPDFKPIVPLPAEIKVTTGEEEETVLFAARAKLFRFADKQWKERGLGEIKLLKHKVTGKVRVLMRREQVHKICANHIITPEMEINQMKNESKAYIWAANDYADETVVLENFCVRFKTADLAKDFYNTFETARQSSISQKIASPQTGKKAESVKPKTSNSNDKVETEKESIKTTNNQGGKTIVGGFTFNSTPTFKAVKDEKPEIKPEAAQTTATLNPFNSFSFKPNTSSPFSGLSNLTSELTKSSDNTTKTPDLNNSDTVEEYEPTIEFKPVIPLPALVETKTGEEDEDILFEHRAKLLRFVPSSKEWKERGLGNIKLLSHKNNPQKVRLLMRREQVMKVCCNHALTKTMVFEKMPNMDKAVTWCAKDFSEGELVSETFCLRFKNVDICDRFIEAVRTAQAKLKDDSKAEKEEQNAAKQTNQTGFGDKFKPKSGSWHCDSCYTNNLESFTKCACCEQPNPKASAQAQSVTTTPVSNWGDKFKPKPGSWECKQCLIHNEASKDICSACNSPKDPSAVNKDTKPVLGGTPKFSFGISAQVSQPQVATTQASVASGWGDKFKPKEGSWECKQCFVRNDGNIDSCCSCNSPKDPNAVKKETSSVLNLGSSSGPKFTFGIPASTTTTTTPETKPAVTTKSSIFDGAGAQKFTFGIQSTAPTNNTNPTGVIFAEPIKSSGQTTPLNFSVKKNEDWSVTVKPALLQTPPKAPDTSDNKEASGKFDFVFKPKSPAVKSPKSNKGDESDGNEYASEDEGHHIHFNPIIPLPDKVEVVTGEENEEELYGHRAKLFRYTSGEWKERGIGVVKVLKHKDTGKIRVLMRREQILKICLNHALTPEINYSAKDDKTWLFAANDFSEGELSLNQFCLRFKTNEIAQQFKDAIDKAQGKKSDSGTPKDSDSDDVVFVSETQATAEEKKLAKQLMLPENFYTYKNKEACQGCRGCDAEVSSQAEANTPAPAAPATPKKTPLVQSQSPFFATPATQSADTSIFRTPMDSLRTGKESSANDTPINTKLDKENKSASQPFMSKPFTFGDNKSLFGTSQVKSGVFGASNIETSSSNKSSILAAPKLNVLNTSKEETTEQKTDPKSVFASAKLSFANNTTSENKSLFAPSSTLSSTSNTEVKPLFGTTVFGTAAPGTTLFGNNNSKDKTEVKSIFGGDPFPKTDNIFASGVKGSLFGPTTTKEQSAPAASNIFGTSTNSSIFGSNSGPVFGGGGSIFGNNNAGNAWTFAANKETSKEKTEVATPEAKSDPKAAADTKATPFKIDNGLLFSALSSTTTTDPGFKQNADFKWEGAGAQLFGGKPAAAGDEATGDDDYDPHYEPIVPLPDKITVTTGEEDEEKLFSERCKLYRYDDAGREWKERGVGDLKILYHPERKTYRLLMRREQIHKAVLNMLLHMDLELHPMKNSDRAWTWAGRNFAESGEGAHETLAVRFKSLDLANSFNAKFVECVRKLQAADAAAIREQKEGKDNSQSIGGVAPLRLPKHLGDSARADPEMTAAATQLQQQAESNGAEEPTAENEPDEEEVYEHNYDEYEDYEGYYNEEEDNPVYYECEGSVQIKQEGADSGCPEAHLQVLYDHEMDSPKVVVADAATGEILADMLIHTETEFQLSESTCAWEGTDYTGPEPVDKAVTATFPDADTAKEFYYSCETSKTATYSSTNPET